MSFQCKVPNIGPHTSGLEEARRMGMDMNKVGEKVMSWVNQQNAPMKPDVYKKEPTEQDRMNYIFRSMKASLIRTAIAISGVDFSKGKDAGAKMQEFLSNPIVAGFLGLAAILPTGDASYDHNISALAGAAFYFMVPCKKVVDGRKEFMAFADSLYATTMKRFFQLKPDGDLSAKQKRDFGNITCRREKLPVASDFAIATLNWARSAAKYCQAAQPTYVRPRPRQSSAVQLPGAE